VAGARVCAACTAAMCVCGACTRGTQVTTINQDTAAVGDEPLDTLGAFRSGKALGLKKKSNTHAVFFAVSRD
jgi:hypothetical protein